MIHILTLRVILFLVMTPYLALSQGQEERLGLYNVGLGAFSSGIGAVINKKKEDWKKCFIRGFWQGGIGGLVNYSSKKSVYLVVNNQNFAYALPARILNCAGNSIIQNAARNEPFLKNWSFEYAFLRLDLSLGAQNNFKVRVLPESIVASAFALSEGKVDLTTTLQTGIMVFKANKWLDGAERTGGVNYGRVFVYLDYPNKYHVVSHEIIHEFQYREWLVINSFFQPVVSKTKDCRFKKIFRDYVYPDVPYFGLAYMINGIYPDEKKFHNFFELEAERFASNKYVDRK